MFINIQRYIFRTFLIVLSLTSMSSMLGMKTFETLFNQATSEFRQGSLDQALITYKQALELNRQCPQIYFNLGLIYNQKQQYDAAIENLQKAISFDPTYSKAMLHLGISYKNNHKLNEAIEQFKSTLKLNPNYHEALCYLARALNENSQFEESALYFKRALALKPNEANIMLELANTLNMDNQTEHALSQYYAIDKIIPNNSAILYNIAYTLKKLNKIDSALPYYRRVLELDPKHAEAHFSLSLAYLASGDFEHGWEEYEWRWKRDNHDARNLGRPLWDGSSLQGKTILLHAEQGLGDGFQFIRYAKILKNQGARVVAAVHPPLVQLFKLCPYLDHVVSLFDTLPQFDTHAPFMTLPYVLKTRLDTIPHDIPYLYADTALVAQWKEKLSADPAYAKSYGGHGKNFKVGICWQGNSNYSTHFLRTAVAAKSIPVTKFLPLFTMPGVTVYNLQKVTGEDQLKNLPANTNLVSFGADFDSDHGRFMDTAAVMKNLDLMITVDTSIAHLAGGLGIPVWCLLPEPADWRWMLTRLDTPWYPNMRLFRQPESEHWDSVIATIVQELSELINTSPDLESQLRNLENQIITIEQLIQEKEKCSCFDDSYSQLTQNLFELHVQLNAKKKESSLHAYFDGQAKK